MCLFLLLCLVVAPIRSLLLPIDSPVSLTPFSSALFDLASESSSPSISRELPGVDFSFVSGDQEHAMTRRPRSRILILGWQSAETRIVSGQPEGVKAHISFFFRLTVIAFLAGIVKLTFTDGTVFQSQEVSFTVIGSAFLLSC